MSEESQAPARKDLTDAQIKAGWHYPTPEEITDLYIPFGHDPNEPIRYCTADDIRAAIIVKPSIFTRILNYFRG